jgi:Rod binding domain-containing protein
MGIGMIDSKFSSALNSATATKMPPVVPTSNAAKARAQAQDFEATFLNSMFQHMFAGVQGDGPMGSTTGTGPWRSFLTDEFAKSMAKKGGIGIADQVYRSLMQHQEARTNPANNVVKVTPATAASVTTPATVQ